MLMQDIRKCGRSRILYISLSVHLSFLSGGQIQQARTRQIPPVALEDKIIVSEGWERGGYQNR